MTRSVKSKHTNLIQIFTKGNAVKHIICYYVNLSQLPFYHRQRKISIQNSNVNPHYILQRNTFLLDSMEFSICYIKSSQLTHSQIGVHISDKPLKLNAKKINCSEFSSEKITPASINTCKMKHFVCDFSTC